MRIPELPWWLNPWGAVRGYRAANLRLLGQLDDWRKRSAENSRAAAHHEKTIRELTDELAKSNRHILRLRGQLSAAVTDSKTSGSSLTDVLPEFVLVGTPRANGGKRLMVSRDLNVTAFAMTEMDDPPPRWKLGVILEKMLMTDAPTYGEALAHIAKIWGNWDRDEAKNPALPHWNKLPAAGEPLKLEALDKGPWPDGWTDLGYTDDGVRLAIGPPGSLPAPGVGVPGDTDAMDGKAGQAEAGQAEDVDAAHPAEERGQAADNEQNDRS